MNKPENRTELSHRALAAIHHEQSARHHHAASVHFETGKDDAHSAHQAILAHGHALQALAYGRMAWREASRSAGDDPVVLKARTARLLDHLLARAEDVTTSLTGAEHHKAAAFHHEAAADLERRAQSHERNSEFRDAARDDAEADEHGEHSIFHSDQAAKYFSL
jgi:hypothetical protein